MTTPTLSGCHPSFLELKRECKKVMNHLHLHFFHTLMFVTLLVWILSSLSGLTWACEEELRIKPDYNKSFHRRRDRLLLIYLVLLRATWIDTSSVAKRDTWIGISAIIKRATGIGFYGVAKRANEIGILTVTKRAAWMALGLWNKELQGSFSSIFYSITV